VRPQARPRVKKHKKKVIVAAKKKKVIVAAKTTSTGKPDQRASRGPSVVPVAADSGASSSNLLLLLFGVALGVSLFVVVLGLTPPWALPRPVLALVYNRRDALIFGGFATAAGIGLGLAIVAGLS
jgi:hypothetical protein